MELDPHGIFKGAREINECTTGRTLHTSPTADTKPLAATDVRPRLPAAVERQT